MSASVADRPPGSILPGSILIVGASRGLGYAMAEELLGRGWTVVGTTRGGATPLHALAERHPSALEVESVDIAEPSQLAALRDRLAHRRFDILFVNAGVSNADPGATVADVSTEEFASVFLIDTLGVMRAVEVLQSLVPDDGTIGVMSSGQGSIGNKTKGGREVYRGSKAALNQCMRSYAARHEGGRRALLLLAPGWIRTELGGPDAPFTVEESAPKIVDVLLGRRGNPGLRFLDRDGKDVPW